MPKYGVFESVNMGSTHYAERIFDAVATVDVENGTFGYLNGLAEGESHVYNFVAGTKEGEKVVVADNPAWSEDTCRITNQRRDNYVIKAGTRFRVRVIKVNDEFGVTVECMTPATREAVKDGSYLTIDANTGKLVVSDASTENAVMEAVVERHRMMGGTLVTAAHKYGYSNVMYEARVKVLA